MAEEPKPTAKLIEKVYDDVAGPSARVVGSKLQATVTTALRPVDGLLWTVNKSFDWVGHVVAALLESRGVQSEEIVTPNLETEREIVLGLQIAGPSSDPIPRNLFAALLATSMWRSTEQTAHPSYASILRQMVGDECRIISVLAASDGTFTLEVRLSARWEWHNQVPRTSANKGSRGNPPDRRPTDRIDKCWHPIAEASQLQSPASLPHYVQNLTRLGLIQEGSLIDRPSPQGATEIIRRITAEANLLVGDLSAQQHSIPDAGEWRLSVASNVLHHYVSLTPFGKQFASCCRSEDFFDARSEVIVMPSWAS